MPRGDRWRPLTAQPVVTSATVAPNAVAVELWDALLGARDDVLPCGLGARDTLRLEMGYPLHGQDLTLEVTPNQARLGWAVGWDKPDFWGRRALVAEKEQGTPVLLRGLLAADRGIPRPHMEVLLGADVPIGEITSGTFSPTLRKGIALALLGKQAKVGDQVMVDVRGRAEVFEVVKPPFVTGGVKEA